jgi:anti-sigma B factor antagonist
MVEFEERGRITVAHIRSADVLDELNVGQFGAELLGFAKANPNANLLLDFAEVKYLSSAVLTELLRVKRALASGEGNLRLAGLKPEIRKVFEITNLDKIMTIHPDVDSAVPRYERSLDIAQEEESWDETIT